MNKQILLRSLIVVSFLATASLEASQKIKVLILDGPQKAHNYLETTPVLKQALESVSIFKVDHSRSSKESCGNGSYQPDFSNYDVVVMNEGFGSFDWPKVTQKAFEKILKEGQEKHHNLGDKLYIDINGNSKSWKLIFPRY